MKQYTINDLYTIAEKGEMKDFFLQQERQEQENIVAMVFGDLIGTCQGDSDSVLAEYGLSEEFLVENGFTEMEVATIFDETVKLCDICGWWVDGQDGDDCEDEEEEEDD